MGILKYVAGLLHSNDKKVILEDASVDFTAMPKISTVPIVENGSNANGNYTKFSDGTLICTMAGSPATAVSTFTFPHPFIDSNTIVNIGAAAGAAIIMTQGTITTTTVEAKRWLHDGTPNSASYGIRIQAIGRWK